MLHCLVTGAAGFIGFHLVRALLQSGCRVTGIDCLTDYYTVSVKESNLRDLMQYETFSFSASDLVAGLDIPEDIEFVFHLAAQPGVRASWRHFDVYTRNNLTATHSLLNQLRSRNIRGLIFASSSSVYGAPERLPVDESCPLRPISPYGVTKLAAESLCFAYANEFGLPLTVLRYFTVYGPRQRPDMGLHIFMKAILQKRPITIHGSGGQRRDYTFVGDVVRASMACMQAPAGRTFNISGGATISLDETIEALRNITGVSFDVHYGEREKGDPAVTSASGEAARNHLGFVARMPFEQGLKQQWDWIRTLGY